MPSDTVTRLSCDGVRISLRIVPGGDWTTVKAPRLAELDVKSPPLIWGKQLGRAVVVTVAVAVIVDTDVIVLVPPMEGHVKGELEHDDPVVTVWVTVEAKGVIVAVAMQLSGLGEDTGDVVPK